MSIIGFHCKRGYRKTEECLACSSRCIHLAVVQEQIEKQSKGYYAPRDDEYHVTSLLGCPRKAVLGRQCGEYIPPQNLWKMQLGTLGHKFMEKHQQGEGVAEYQLQYRYYIPIGKKSYNAMVVGRFDWYDGITKFINDYKFVGSTDYMPDRKHFRQIALYRIIGVKSGEFNLTDVAGSQIIYIYMPTGQPFYFTEEKEAFQKTVDEMEVYAPAMIRHYLEASINGVVPEGDVTKEECAYCPDEFRNFCNPAKFKKNPPRSEGSLVVMAANVEKFRKENTPPDES